MAKELCPNCDGVIAIGLALDGEEITCPYCGVRLGVSVEEIVELYEVEDEEPYDD